MSTETFTPAGRVIPEWTIADRLRKVRRMVGLDQEQFAEAVRMKRSSIQAWEAGRSKPSHANKMLLAMMIEVRFGVPVDWTLAEEPDDPSIAFARAAGAGVRHYAVTGEELDPTGRGVETVLAEMAEAPTPESTSGPLVGLPRLDSNQQPSG